LFFSGGQKMIAAEPSILDKMREGVGFKFQIRLRSAVITMRPLSVQEQVNIISEVADEIQARPKLANNAFAGSVIMAMKTLSTASQSAPNSRDQQLPTGVLNELHSDELMHLFKSYNAECDKICPMLEDLSEERLDQLISLAKKNPTVWIDCSFVELVGACRRLTQLTQPQDKSSGG
jgi:hypothetical protein